MITEIDTTLPEGNTDIEIDKAGESSILITFSLPMPYDAVRLFIDNPTADALRDALTKWRERKGE